MEVKSFCEKKNICNYPNKIKKRLIISKLFIIFSRKEFDEKFLNEKIFSICGRVFRKRVMGKASFLELRDFSGNIQLYLSSYVLQSYYEIMYNLNLGDLIHVEGKLFRTHSGEISIKVLFFNVLSKNFKSFPDKWEGLVDKELCYRYRYLDLMVNDESKKKFIIRSKILYLIRQFFYKRDYLEVETPIMQSIIGGADAKPFETYHNYLGNKLYLRVSPELYLKRLIVGGFEKVFEIGKSFRNEGISVKHNPEFTMIEFYQAYSNYKDLILLTQNLFKYVAFSLTGKLFIEYNNFLIDFSKKFDQISFFDSIVKYSGISLKDLNDFNFLIVFFKEKNIDFDEKFSISDFHVKLFDVFVEKNLFFPTFILYYPIEISPLARCKDDSSLLVERFELYICGKEIANGFSELNDPTDQSNRFLKQLALNDDVNLKYDADYINSLMYGLPPTAGEGIGIDRLVMLFTNSLSIKDVLFFPLMRHK
ncbi:lysine--tRNA ligase [Candidatus Azoamicus ciliaticola]|uniref:Lysine--tRNA ligase n=1 Tax=Candidatus Azoamicus ciliaticola TaxID=2652803 RepID=A0A6J5JVV9_9GAMM|nr:lysine--tRNA ligase [Candidatus Azoamicus ciliaticola]CAB3976448.1 Lysine--tRNA ligase [Candidatus Azoamicus ciliaticola]